MENGRERQVGGEMCRTMHENNFKKDSPVLYFSFREHGECHRDKKIKQQYCDKKLKQQNSLSTSAGRVDPSGGAGSSAQVVTPQEKARH